MDNYTILIVDDSPDNLKTIADYLKDSELSVNILKAPNGRIACNLAEKKLPDLIIMDWEMPEMDGIEAIKHLMSSELTNDIPVIMASGVMTSTENLKTAMDAGAVDYIRKPVDKTELTARVNSMLKLSESYKKIKVLNATKDKFFSIIAHDLKAPLGGLSELTEIFYNQYNSFGEDERKNIIKLLHENSKTTFNLLKNLLSWTLSQRNKMIFNPESFSAYEVISETCILLKSAAEDKNIDISTSCEEELNISADKNMLLTIFRNLLSNAIKFTSEKGGIKVGCEKTNEGYIEYWVQDTGTGMNKQQLDKLFKIGEQISMEGTKNEKGSGLGLLLCKEFVEKHNGKIWVESEIGKGSCFRFVIPQQYTVSTH